MDDKRALRLREKLQCPVWDKPAALRGGKGGLWATLEAVEPFEEELRAWMDEKMAAA